MQGPYLEEDSMLTKGITLGTAVKSSPVGSSKRLKSAGCTNDTQCPPLQPIFPASIPD